MGERDNTYFVKKLRLNFNNKRVVRQTNISHQTQVNLDFDEKEHDFNNVKTCGLS